ncbi:MAG TPA: TonB-dependent receptor [Longimicrobiaceae bacterium]|nr:TonB-dependent receptor [Longimicrobiaceae bacterium]
MVASVLLALASPLSAQVVGDTIPQDSVFALEGVVVSTTRQVTTVGGASALTVTVDSMHVPPAPSLEMVLREMPFVQVRQNSRGQTEIAVRGSESRQVAVLMDGIPLTIGWDHRTDPSIVPMMGARSVMLVRGLSSVLHGPNVLGGVIEVDVSQGGTPALDMPQEVQLRAGLDHLGGYALSAVGGQPVQFTNGDLEIRAGIGYSSRPGYALASDVNDPAAEDGIRTNTDAEHVDGFAALRYHSLDGGWLGFSASAYKGERGVPAELHVEEPRLWRYPDSSRLLAVLSGGTGMVTTPLGEGDLEASFGVDLGTTEIESFTTNQYDVIAGTESGDDRTLTFRALGDHTIGAGMLSSAFTYADVTHDELIDGTEANRYRQRLWSLGSELSFPVAGTAEISGGIVIDGADTPESGDKPPLDRLWAWGGRLGGTTLIGEDVRLHASLSSRARFPSLRELYSGALGRFEPNPDLRPERLLGGEAGATLQRDNLELQGVVFHHRLSDAIVRASVGNGMLRRENQHEIRSTGIELLAGWNAEGISILGDLMVQRVNVIDPSVPSGERLPEHMPTFRTGADLTIPVGLGVRALAAAQYTGEQFCVHPDLETKVELGGSFRADLGLDRAWDGFRTTLSLDNVGDSAIYDVCGLPQPGRTLRLTVETDF